MNNKNRFFKIDIRIIQAICDELRDADNDYRIKNYGNFKQKFDEIYNCITRINYEKLGKDRNKIININYNEHPDPIGTIKLL
jgi:hypothetical protein